MDETTLNQFATKIALHCQKAARGIKARDEAQIKRWEKANVAAYRIQTAFRTWRMLQFTRKRYKKVTKKKIDKSTGIWERVLNDKGSHSDKMVIWRNVIELRRGFPEYSTEVCLKALVRTNGDLTKAIPLLGSRDFGYQAQYGAPLPEEIKDSLNPYSRAFFTEDSIEKMARNPRSMSSCSRRAHRHLQESLHTNSASFISPAYDLQNAVMRSYFSKNCIHVPVTTGKKALGRPKSAAVKS